MTTITSHLTPALKTTCRRSSIHRRGRVHRKHSTALLYFPHQRAAVQLLLLLSRPLVPDPQILPRTGAETPASPQRCLSTRMGTYSIIRPCLTQGITGLLPMKLHSSHPYPTTLLQNTGVRLHTLRWMSKLGRRLKFHPRVQ